MNTYQAGNLLGLLKRSHDYNNGDWFHELASKCLDALMNPVVEEGFDFTKKIDGDWTNNFGDRIPTNDTTEFWNWLNNREAAPTGGAGTGQSRGGGNDPALALATDVGLEMDIDLNALMRMSDKAREAGDFDHYVPEDDGL